MPVTPETRNELRMNNLTLEAVASADNLNTPQSGDRGIGALTDGSILTKDPDGVSHYMHGAQQQLAVSPKGSVGTIKVAETEVTCSSGSTITATGLFPAKVLQLGVVARVTTLIVGPTSFKIGDGSDADRYGNAIALLKDTVTTEADFTADPHGWSASAGDVVLTATGSNFSAGKVRLSAYYIEFDGPTS